MRSVKILIINVLIPLLTRFLFGAKSKERNHIDANELEYQGSNWNRVCFDKEYIEKLKKSLKNYKF